MGTLMDFLRALSVIFFGLHLLLRNPTNPFTISGLQNPSHDVSEQKEWADLLIVKLLNCERVGREVHML